MSEVVDSSSQTSRNWALFLVSLLGLFLELLLIRWIGTEVRIFAYLQNTVLVVCFLGLGMGCWTCRKPFVLRDMLMPLAILVLLLAIPITRTGLGRISEMLSAFGGLIIWNQVDPGSFARQILLGIVGLVLTFLLMVLIWAIFVPIGRLLGRLMDDHPRPLWAYSINVLGSLIGIWLFVFLSAFSLPPVVWFLVAAVMVVLLLWTSEVRFLPTTDLALLGGIVVLSWLAGVEGGAMDVAWSPYQKLVLRRSNPEAGEIGEYIIDVNNAGYQAMVDLDIGRTKKRSAADPQLFPPEQLGLSQYDLPAVLHPNPKKMLIVGAGSGNDAAGALRQGVADVVAVEIDPAIIEMGIRVHPEQPYSDARVRVVNDDARSYFATTPERDFDVIAFGLLDSHTTTAMTNARLDHYVYTREALERAKSLLKESGIVVLSFEAQKPFIADRMAGVLKDVFGQDPLCFRITLNGYGWGGVVFVVGDLKAVQARIDANDKLKTLIKNWQTAKPVEITGNTPIATDDWPYIYLESRSIPPLYFFLAGMLLLLLWLGMRRLQTPNLFGNWDRTSWHFFFLGAAFLLLEVQNISKAAVVLGNTWQVNAVIISSILMLILVANGIVARLPGLPLGPVFVLLCGTCLGLYFINISTFAFLPYATKALVVGGLTSLPMLFSGIIFARSFSAASRKDLALGANLFGALVGGLLQSITFVTGIKFLLLIVAALYAAAYMMRPIKQTAEVLKQPDEQTAGIQASEVK